MAPAEEHKGMFRQAYEAGVRRASDIALSYLIKQRNINRRSAAEEILACVEQPTVIDIPSKEERDLLELELKMEQAFARSRKQHEK